MHTSNSGLVSLQVLALQASFVAQLQVAGLPQWAAYIACSSPATHPAAGAGRDSVVRELLCASAPAWGGSTETCELLGERLKLPDTWLASARALQARQQLQPLGEPPGARR